MGAVNEAKLMCKWRAVLRQAKTTTLSHQLQVWQLCRILIVALGPPHRFVYYDQLRVGI